MNPIEAAAAHTKYGPFDSSKGDLTLDTWADDCLEFDPSARTLAKDLFSNFCSYHYGPFSRRMFSNVLIDRGLTQSKSMGQRYFNGLRIRADVDPSAAARARMMLPQLPNRVSE